MRAVKTSQYTWQTLHEILGVAVGASIDHIKESYRLLSKKNSLTDAAYHTLIDPEERGKYGPLLQRNHSSSTEDGKDWGKRGRERCSCGRLLGEDDDWLCQECWDRQIYIVAFDMSGARIVHQDEFPWPSPDSEEKAPDAVAFGPFTIEEAEQFLAEMTLKRNRGPI
ncbi:MAG: hypothetical protein WB952_00560 [Terriglobales bacterium]